MSDANTKPISQLALLVACQARTYGARRFLGDAHTGQTTTYAELAGAVGRWAAALDGAAIPPRSRVLIDLRNPLDFCAAYIGVIAAGRCAVPVNPQAPDAELVRTAGVVAPAGVIADRPDRTRPLPVPMLSAHPADAAPGGARPTQPGSVLLLTSGSTGAPKAVELSEDRLLHVARAAAAHNELTPQDRGFSPLPLFHINAEVVALLATLTAGGELLLDRRFRRHGFWESLAQHDVTWCNLVPAILTILAQYPVSVRPPRLRFIRSASAPLPVAVRERIAALAGGVAVIESYGMTEAASQITATPLDGTAPAGSCGRPVGAQVQVRDDDGRPIAPGMIGQIWITGDGVIDAYDGGRYPERFDSGGWLSTGDRGYLDENGFLFLAGRSDDVINRGGEMLYPREIEEVLIADPAVGDAVVVGRADPILGQVPVAYVIPASANMNAEAKQALLDDLVARCSVHLSRYKVPDELCLVDDLPRAATGKIRRSALASHGRERLAEAA